MPAWLTWILGFILKGFGIGQAPDPVDQATATGEKLGKSEQETVNATGAVSELEHAQQGSADAHAAVAADPDRLRRDDDPSVRVWKPGQAD